MTQPITIESDQTTLPFEVAHKFKGKRIQFVKFDDGFVMKPIPDAKPHSKLAKLKWRELVIDDSEELVNVKVDEGNEMKNL